MAKNLVELEFEIDQRSIDKMSKQSKRVIEKAAAIAVERMVKRVEDATLITQYTQNARPAKPAGSTYIRTFRLQSSSETRLVRDTFPIEARWEAKTEYASFVIGMAEDQAEIHKGRWPSLELAITNVNMTAQDEFDKAMEKVNK